MQGLIDGFPNITENDVILTAQPFHYIDPQWNVALGLASGCRLVVLDRFHPSSFWSKIIEYGVTWFYCLGMMPKLLLSAPAPARPDTLRSVCASAIPPELHRDLEARWGVPWFEAFGMTETGSDIRLDPRDHDECVGTGCLGRAVPGREARIVDEADNPVAPGATGQLVVRGAGMMTGYFRDPDATREVFRNGWMHTGDLARMDERGRIYFVGRTKDMIRRSGENIAAAEVERVLQLHPAVTMAAVLAEPDELRGEEVHAVIVAADGHGATDLADLIEHCQRQLAYFKVPRYWTFVAELPLTASQRVAKGELRAQPRRGDDIEDPGVDLGLVPEVRDPPGRTDVRPGAGLAAEQAPWRPLRVGVPQRSHPLGGFPHHHARVVDRAGHQEVGSAAGGRQVVVRRVREHPVELLADARVAPLLPLGDRQRGVLVEHRGDHVDERHLRHDGPPSVGSLA